MSGGRVYKVETKGEMAALAGHSVEGCHLGSSSSSRHLSLGQEPRRPLCVCLSGNRWLLHEQAAVRQQRGPVSLEGSCWGWK